ncbi:cytochrome P450 [Delitschia confertaspora ATCC 74209]|uniref:Cytochrome P450 n=1 Tax=Delitschia confertaspora ATCC 74209 TaxID=1513339 RepID=A0A9P4JM26_9PLEO|nr:cytochrome P450 [Delitschia confertaspora ATCC 74209]
MYRIYVGDMDIVQRRLHKKYGPLVRIAPNEVSSSDPADIPKIYRSQGPLIKTDFYTTWGSKSISTQPDQFTCIDEQEHTRYRKIVLPVYSLANVLKLEDYVANCTRMFIQRMHEFVDNDQEVDLGEWLLMYAYDVVGELFFGKMFGFMQNACDYGQLIATNNILVPLLCISGTGPAYYRPLIMGSAVVFPPVQRACRSVNEIIKATKILVTHKKKEMSQGIEDRVSFFQQLMKIVSEKGEKLNFTENEVTLESWVFMLAGSDTTAIALRACFYYLMKNPSALMKCYAEIDSVSSSLSSPVRYTESLKQLPFTCASIKEAMRLFPSVALSMQRYAPAEGVELCGIFIPKGWRVGINPAVVHYDKGLFGEDAELFRPDRWLVSEERTKQMEKAMLIFGAGTRTCLGKNVSLAEIYTLVPEVLRTFRMEMAHDRPWTTSNRWFNKQSDIIVKIKHRR